MTVIDLQNSLIHCFYSNEKCIYMSEIAHSFKIHLLPRTRSPFIRNASPPTDALHLRCVLHLYSQYNTTDMWSYYVIWEICDPNFARLVLGCLESDFRNQILVGKLLTRSMRFTSFHTSLIAICFFIFGKYKNNLPRNIAQFWLLNTSFVAIVAHFNDISSDFKIF